MKKPFIIGKNLTEEILEKKIVELNKNKQKLSGESYLLLVGKKLEKDAVIITGSIKRYGMYIGKVNLFVKPEIKGWILLKVVW